MEETVISVILEGNDYRFTWPDAIQIRQCLFCHEDASSNRLGRNKVNTKDKPKANPNLNP